MMILFCATLRLIYYDSRKWFNLDSTPRSQKIDNVDKIFPKVHFSGPFKYLRRAFQESIEVITKASLKKLLYAFSVVVYFVTRAGQ